MRRGACQRTRVRCWLLQVRHSCRLPVLAHAGGWSSCTKLGCSRPASTACCPALTACCLPPPQSPLARRLRRLCYQLALPIPQLPALVHAMQIYAGFTTSPAQLPAARANHSCHQPTHAAAAPSRPPARPWPPGQTPASWSSPAEGNQCATHMSELVGDGGGMSAAPLTRTRLVPPLSLSKASMGTTAANVAAPPAGQMACRSLANCNARHSTARRRTSAIAEKSSHTIMSAAALCSAVDSASFFSFLFMLMDQSRGCGMRDGEAATAGQNQAAAE